MSMPQAEIIYELMIGEWDVERFPVPEAMLVENEYEEGKLCEMEYNRAYAARERLFDRLGVYDDGDVSVIMSCMMKIGKHLAMKMFEYGAFCGALRAEAWGGTGASEEISP